jgi:hypothetical protein
MSAVRSFSQVWQTLETHNFPCLCDGSKRQFHKSKTAESLQLTSDGSTAIYKLSTTPKREQRSSKEKKGVQNYHKIGRQQNRPPSYP